MYVLDLLKIAEVIGPFETEEDAYTYADKYFGDLNPDEFDVWALTLPNEDTAKEIRDLHKL